MFDGSQPIEGFLDDVAGGTVPPAGGTVAAVVGAMGAALARMVCVNSTDRPSSGGDLADARERLDRHRERLLDLAGRDAAAVEEMMAAAGADEDYVGTEEATGVPLAIAEECLGVLEAAADVAERSNQNLVVDATSGAYFADAGVGSAVAMVRTNVEHLENDTVAEEASSRVDRIETRAAELRDRIAEVTAERR